MAPAPGLAPELVPEQEVLQLEQPHHLLLRQREGFDR
jgi:hypothetical protein